MTLLIRRNIDHCVFDKPCVAAIGNFDGLHLGHQEILAQLQACAKQQNLPSMVITFEPSPLFFFKKEKGLKRIMTVSEKFFILQSLGIDFVLILRFNQKLALVSAEEFTKRLAQGLQVKQVVVGEDFRFGHQRKGDVAFLRNMGAVYGFEVLIVPTVQLKGEKVSSSRVRAALSEGNLVEAEQLLGRKVEHHNE